MLSNLMLPELLVDDQTMISFTIEIPSEDIQEDWTANFNHVQNKQGMNLLTTSYPGMSM
ncbi:MAG: hypothetical protein ABEJ65_03235 [bacterium]